LSKNVEKQIINMARVYRQKMKPSVTTLQNKTPTLGQGQTTLAQGQSLFGFTLIPKDYPSVTLVRAIAAACASVNILRTNDC
jgi:hypothetical protein